MKNCCEKGYKESVVDRCVIGPLLVFAGLGMIYIAVEFPPSMGGLLIGWATVLGGAYTGIASAIQLRKLKEKTKSQIGR